MPVFLPSGEHYAPRERLLRLLALGAVIALVAWAFWEHSDRTIGMLENRQAVQDHTETLTERQLAFCKGFGGELKSRYGLSFRLLVANGPLPELKADQKTLSIGLSPQQGRSVWLVPPLLQTALGQEFIDSQRANLEAAAKAGTWPEALLLSLAAVWDRLEKLQTPGSEESQPNG